MPNHATAWAVEKLGLCGKSRISVRGDLESVWSERVGCVQCHFDGTVAGCAAFAKNSLHEGHDAKQLLRLAHHLEYGTP